MRPLLMTVALLLACAGPRPATRAESGLVLTSPAFTEGGAIPPRHSAYADNLSPELNWTSPPAGTRSFALICRDPDAPSGTFYHWVIFNLPDTLRSLPEALPRDATPSGGVQGINSFGRPGYDGPRPPFGTHRYYFDLYCLDTVLVLDRTATADKVLAALKDRVLGRAGLMGRYSK
ncbi:MAG: YbhB/YbcL family Raf kinase inhibitor-like protein [candidate division WOR-3 bacterium]